MPCSCSVGKKLKYAEPGTYQTREVQQSTLQDSNHVRTYVQIGQQLDTSSNTAPDQLCFNCVRKHLGLSYMFLRAAGRDRFFAAIGQLLCASVHLRQKYTNLAYKIRDTAVRLLRGDIQNNLTAVRDLITELQKDPAADLPQYVPLPSFPQEQQLLTVMLVQSLLFIQLTYQEVNKTWATAQLSFFSYNAFRTTNALKHYETYRPLWKLIQSMQFMDQNYIAARDYIHSLLVSKYPYYQQIVLPKKREQFKQDYAKQKQLMQ